MPREILAASWVVPISGPPIRDGAVAVEDRRIAWVGHLASRPPGDLRELGGGVLLPGLVNAHCHLELSWLAGRLPCEQGFVTWVEALVAARAGEEESRVRQAVAGALVQLAGTGTVAIGDVSNRLAHLDLLAESGIEAVVFFELLGFDPAAAERVWDGAHERLQRLPSNGRVEVRLAAHAPHSVSTELLRALVREGGPAAIHLAESPAEMEFLATGSGEWAAFLEARLGRVDFAAPGTSPVRYLDGLGALHPRLVAAHAVQVDGEDRSLLAQRGVSVALCPRSNLSLGLGLPPLPELLADGVRVCLGTDSLASAPSLDLLQDAALLRRAYPGVPAATLVRMATVGGAEALGLRDLGMLEPGKRAALAFAPAPAALEDPLAFLVSGEARAAVVPA